MTTGLLLTVGDTTGSEIFSINKLSPDWVAFLCTPASRDKIDQIVKGTSLDPHQCQLFETSDSPESIGKLVFKAHEAYQWLNEKCGAGAEIVINPTGGRKWMSVALSLFASRTGSTQVYVHVDYPNGELDPDTMKLVELGNAQDHTGLFEADLGVGLFNRGDYEGAAEVFGHITPKSCAARQLYQGLKGLSDALRRWDQFEHYGGASGVTRDGVSSLREIKTAAEELQLLALQRFASSMEVLLSRIREVETKKKNNLSAVVDLAENASRRIKAGRFDDGVARLYRALEATAQCLLDEMGINTSNVDWGQVSPEAQKKFRRACRLSDQNPDKISLEQAFNLCRALNNGRIGLFFNQRGDFIYRKHTSGRNDSILAHGWEYLAQSRAEKFRDQLQIDLEKLGADFSGWQVPTMPRLWS